VRDLARDESRHRCSDRDGDRPRRHRIDRPGLPGRRHRLHTQAVLWPTLPHRIGFILRARDNMRALQVSEQKNRALLQALPDTIFIVGRDGALLEHITGDDKGNGFSLVGRQLEQVLPSGVPAPRARRSAAWEGVNSAPTSLPSVAARTSDHSSAAASATRWHAADRDARYHRAAKGQGADRIPGVLRYIDRLANRQQFVRQAGARYRPRNRAAA